MIGRGLLWDFIGKIFNQSVGFVISILLARMLTPEEFGLVGMVMVILIMAEVFVGLGFGASLIQRKKVSEKLFSSVFWLNVGMGLLMTCILYIFAGAISNFYNLPQLKLMVKVLSLSFIIGSFGIIKSVRLTKRMDFKKQAIVSVISNTLSGVVGVFMAYYNFGVWALITQQLLNRLITVVALYRIERWIPLFHFSFSDIKLIWGYSSKKFLTDMLRTFLGKMDLIIIAKLFVPATLGYYTRSRSFTDLVISYSSGSLNKVFFPYVSQLQDTPEKLKEIYNKSLTLVGFYSVGLSILLLVISNELFILLFTEKWLKSAYFFQFMIIADAFTKPLGSIMLNLILGLGHAGTELKLLLIKRTVWLLPLFILYKFGIDAFLYSTILHAIFVFIIDGYSVSKHFPITIYEQSKEVLKFASIAIITAYIISFVPKTSTIILDIIVKGGLTMVIYISGVFIVAPKPITLSIEQLKKLNYEKK